MSSPKSPGILLWIIVLLALVALIIDLLDGYTPKMLTSLGLVVGLTSLLVMRLTGIQAFRWLAIAGLVLCIGSAVYRAALHQGWIG